MICIAPLSVADTLQSHPIPTAAVAYHSMTVWCTYCGKPPVPSRTPQLVDDDRCDSVHTRHTKNQRHVEGRDVLHAALHNSAAMRQSFVNATTAADNAQANSFERSARVHMSRPAEAPLHSLEPMASVSETASPTAVAHSGTLAGREYFHIHEETAVGHAPILCQVVKQRAWVV